MVMPVVRDESYEASRTRQSLQSKKSHLFKLYCTSVYRCGCPAKVIQRIWFVLYSTSGCSVTHGVFRMM